MNIKKRNLKVLLINKTAFSAIFIFLLDFSFAGEIITVTADSAVKLALENNPELKKLEQDVKMAEAQYGESTADLIPAVSLNGNFTYYDPNTVQNSTVNYETLLGSASSLLASEGIPSVLTNIFPDNYSAGISISYPLPIPLTTGSKSFDVLKLKKINLDLAKKKYEEGKNAVNCNTLIAFYNLFLNKENVLLFEELDLSLSNQLKKITLNFQKGAATEYERLSVDVEYKNNQSRLVESRNEYETAELSLTEALGIDTTNVEFIGSLLDSTNISINYSGESNVLIAAFSNNISLISLDYSLEIQKLSLEIDRKNKLPLISTFANIGYNYSRTNSFQNLRSWNLGWNLGLQLSLPVNEWFPFSKTEYTSKEREAEINKIKETRRQIIDDITVRVSSFLSQIEVSRTRILSTEEGMEAAKLRLNIANRGFAIGTSTIQDIIDSQASYTQARVNWMKAIYDHYISVLKLKKITGENL